MGKYDFITKQPRGIGKTTIMCEALKDKDCILVVRDQNEANRLLKIYPDLKVISFNSNNSNCLGINKPTYVDPDVLDVLVQDTEKETARKIVDMISEFVYFDDGRFNIDGFRDRLRKRFGLREDL